MAPINRGFLTAGLLTVVGTAIVAFGYVGNDNVRRRLEVLRRRRSPASCSPRRSAGSPSTSPRPRPRPVREIAEATRTGPATVVLSGISSGLESSVYAIIGIAVALGVGIWLGDGNIQFTFYLVALTGMGMLATTGVVVSEDTFGPVADNAAGIAEMSGEFEGEPERIMVSLDAVGNTTKAVTKGFAIGSAVIAVGRAVRLATSRRSAASSNPLKGITGNRAVQQLAHPDQRGQPEDLHRPAHRRLGRRSCSRALAIRAVGRTAGVVVQEVRSQFADGGIMAGTKKPDYGPVIDICTAASLRELATPALLAVLTPVIIGFGINYLRARRVPRRRDPHRPAHGQLPVATPVVRGTTPRSTSRTATRAARAPRPTRPPSSATPSATRSRTPPVPR